MIGSSSGASTVGRCAVDSFPDACGCGEPPQLVERPACGTPVMSLTHTTAHTVTEGAQSHALCLSAATAAAPRVLHYVTLTCFRLSTVHPQVQPDGGHDVTVSCAGASTVGRCAVGSLPQARGCAKPPQLGGAACMRHGSHESYTHHSTHSHSRCKEAHSLPQRGNSTSATCVAHTSPSPEPVFPPCTHRSSPTDVMT